MDKIAIKIFEELLKTYVNGPSVEVVNEYSKIKISDGKYILTHTDGNKYEFDKAEDIVNSTSIDLCLIDLNTILEKIEYKFSFEINS